MVVRGLRFTLSLNGVVVYRCCLVNAHGAANWCSLCIVCRMLSAGVRSNSGAFSAHAWIEGGKVGGPVDALKSL